MSLLIKALQKAEQGKEAKNGDSRPAVPSGLALELAPQESNPVPAAAASEAAAPLEFSDNGFSLEQESAIVNSSDVSSPANPRAAGVDASLEAEMGFSLADEAGFTVPPVIPAPSAALPKDPVKVSAPPPVQAHQSVEPKAGDVPPSSPTQSQPAADQQRLAAASMLNLQQGDHPVARLRSRRSVVLGTIALLLLLALGGGFYYYLGTLDQSQFVAVTPPPAKLPPVPSPKPAISPAAAPANTAETGTVSSAASPAVNPPPEVTAPLTKDLVREGGNDAPKLERKPAKPAAPRLPTGGAEAPMPKVARMQKTEAAINAIQLAAYQALNAGDDPTAERLYRQLSESEPRNVDVLLGLAAVAAKQDKTDQAVKIYQRVLELEPRNSVALAGIMTTLGQSNPAEAESRLKQLIAQQPDAAYLHAVLGNLYSDLNRWPDAQQSYFQAFRMDSGNADYAFNLAVSLDQIAKYDLALDYYQKASALLAKQGGNMDKAALDGRILELRERLRK